MSPATTRIHHDGVLTSLLQLPRMMDMTEGVIRARARSSGHQPKVFEYRAGSSTWKPFARLTIVAPSSTTTGLHRRAAGPTPTG